MRILITGASGLVGSALQPYLSTRGNVVTPIVRRRPAPGTDAIFWDPAAGDIDAAAMEGADAVVHLAGESLSAGRWTPERKTRIRDSRVQATDLLARTLACLTRPPRVLVCASAVGCYGDRGNEVLTEESSLGSDFLAGVCRAWEAMSQPAEDAGIRVVKTRFGMILSPAGGALAKLLLPFRLGIGGRLGSGKQYMSWVAIDDVAAAIDHVLETDSLRGPVNTVSPFPVTNLEFTRTLGRVLSRPTLLPIPAQMLRLLFGEMADEVLLASQRAEPERLLHSGFAFHSLN
jgi:uncharacterized protein